MYHFSESDMGDVFEKALLKSKIFKKYKLNVVERELVSHQGIPDFVAMHKLSDANNVVLFHPEASCKILACLKKKSGRSIKYIKKTTGLSEYIIKKALKNLIEKDLVNEDKELFYFSSDMFESDIWAFELKLADWKRAIFQGLQYKAFATYSVTVFPMEKEKIIQTNINLFKKLNVGALIFDIETSKSKWLNKPLKSKPISKWQKIYMHIKILNSLDNNKNKGV